MTDQKTPQLVVARLKTGGFSRTGSPEEVFSSLQKLLPVDNLYFIVPHPDGKGYELREVGKVVVDFQAIDELPKSEVVIPTPSTSKPPIPRQESVMDQGEVFVDQAIPTPSPMEGYSFQKPDTGFKFDRPKSQSEALAERGIHERPVRLHKPVIDDPKELVNKSAQVGIPVKKKTRKSSKSKVKSEDLSGDDWDKGLPVPPRAGRSVVQVNNIQTATPEQAEAASHFGKTL